MNLGSLRTLTQCRDLQTGTDDTTRFSSSSVPTSRLTKYAVSSVVYVLCCREDSLIEVVLIWIPVRRTRHDCEKVCNPQRGSLVSRVAECWLFRCLVQSGMVFMNTVNLVIILFFSDPVVRSPVFSNTIFMNTIVAVSIQ